jgi:FXSXX-COOH protein
MHGCPGEQWPEVPDLTGLPLDEILQSSGTVLANALRRVLCQVAGAEPPIAAYDSGAQLLLQGLDPGPSTTDDASR